MFPNLDPFIDFRDEGYNEEAYLQAVLGRIVAVIFASVIALVIFALTSCASHKQVCGVTSEMADSLTAIIDSTVHVTRVDTSITSLSAGEEYHQTVTDTNLDEECETITEHITETTDSLGNRTTITERTTQRNRKSSSTSLTDTEQRKQEELLCLILSYLDSVADSRTHITNTHDSSNITYSEEKQKGSSVLSVLPKYIDVTFCAVIIAIIAVIAYLAVKYWQNK